jgi:hypothetical protein
MNVTEPSGIISLYSLSNKEIKPRMIFQRLKRSSPRPWTSYRSEEMQRRTKMNKFKLALSQPLRTSSSSNSRIRVNPGRRKEQKSKKK